MAIRERSCAWAAVLAMTMGLALAGPTQAAPGVRTSDSGTVAGSYTYSETATDMKVKVLGGHVRIQREFRGKRGWQFFPAWQRLEPQLGEQVGGVGFSDLAPDQVPEALVRGRYTYEHVDGSDPARWRFDETRWIEATDTGYRWANRSGEWITYDDQGRITAYGGRNDVPVRFERDDAGRIKRVLDHHGEVAVTITYDGQGRVVRIRDRAGREVRYEWEQQRRLVAVNDVRGERWEYGYATKAGGLRLTSRTDPDGRTTTFEYATIGGGVQCVPTGDGHWKRDSSGKAVWAGQGRCIKKFVPKRAYVAAKKDARGTIESYTYAFNGDDDEFVRATEQGDRLTERKLDDQGRLTERRVNGEVVERYRYDDNSRVRIDSRGNETRTELNSYDEPVRKVYPDGATETWRYNAYGQVTRHVNEVGTITERTYDDNGNRIKTIEAKGTPAERVIEYAYDQYGQRTARTLVGDANTKQGTRRWTYDRYGNVKTMTDAAGHTRTVTAYNVRGQAEAWTDRGGYDWQQTFDAAGNRLSKTDPLGHQQTWSYDGAGHRVAQTNALGNRTEYTFDDAGLLVAVTDPTGATTQLAYDGQRRVTETTDADGVTRKLVYNDAGRLAKRVDPAGIAQRMVYGDDKANAGADQLARIEGPRRTIAYRYDARGRRTAEIVTGDDGTRQVTKYRYDAAGRRTAMTDPGGRTTQYSYDALGRRTRTTDPQGNTVERTYEDRGNVTKVVNKRGVTLRRYTYSARGLRTKVVWPAGETHRYAYDAKERRIRYTDAKGQIEATSYDAAGRRTEVTYYASESKRQAGNPARTTTFSYDAAGRLTGYDDGTSSATYSYDAAGRKTGAEIDFGAFTTGWSRTYTAAGRKKSLTYPDGDTVTYDYDDAGRLATITRAGGQTLAFGYSDKTGRKKRLTLPGGSQRSWSYDGLGRIQRIGAKDPAGNPLDERRYTYSEAGNITRIDTLEGAHTYGYDNLDRLTSATHPKLDDEAFTYDAAGNRTTSADTDGPWQYNAANQLTGFDDTTFTYDANGAMINKVSPEGTTTYEYGVRRRLKRIEMPDGTTQTNAYDPMERRVRKTVDGKTTYFVYTEAGLVAELDGDGHAVTDYGWIESKQSNPDPLWIQTTTSVGYYHSDHLGRPIQAVTRAGADLWSAKYQAFGAARLSTSKISSPLRFPGQYQSGVGPAYNHHRFYSPELGRYQRSDPVGIDGGRNTYAYADANPVNEIDPNGLRSRRPGPPDFIPRPEPKDRYPKEWEHAVYGDSSNCSCVTDCLQSPAAKVTCNVVAAALGGILGGMVAPFWGAPVGTLVGIWVCWSIAESYCAYRCQDACCRE